MRYLMAAHRIVTVPVSLQIPARRDVDETSRDVGFWIRMLDEE